MLHVVPNIYWYAGDTIILCSIKSWVKYWMLKIIPNSQSYSHRQRLVSWLMINRRKMYISGIHFDQHMKRNIHINKTVKILRYMLLIFYRFKMVLLYQFIIVLFIVWLPMVLQHGYHPMLFWKVPWYFDSFEKRTRKIVLGVDDHDNNNCKVNIVLTINRSYCLKSDVAY